MTGCIRLYLRDGLLRRWHHPHGQIRKTSFTESRPSVNTSSQTHSGLCVAAVSPHCGKVNTDFIRTWGELLETLIDYSPFLSLFSLLMALEGTDTEPMCRTQEDNQVLKHLIWTCVLFVINKLSDLSMSVCVYACVYVYVYIYICMCMYMYLCICMYVCVCVCIYIYLN